MAHQVETEHIIKLINNGKALAKLADGKGSSIHKRDFPEGLLDEHVAKGKDFIPLESVLEKAAADLRQAAEKLLAERYFLDALQKL